MLRRGCSPIRASTPFSSAASFRQSPTMGQRPNQNKAAICEKADAFHLSKANILERACAYK
jgi:hypothetical protein